MLETLHPPLYREFQCHKPHNDIFCLIVIPFCVSFSNRLAIIQKHLFFKDSSESLAFFPDNKMSTPGLKKHVPKECFEKKAIYGHYFFNSVGCPQQ